MDSPPPLHERPADVNRPALPPSTGPPPPPPSTGTPVDLQPRVPPPENQSRADSDPGGPTDDSDILPAPAQLELAGDAPRPACQGGSAIGPRTLATSHVEVVVELEVAADVGLDNQPGDSRIRREAVSKPEAPVAPQATAANQPNPNSATEIRGEPSPDLSARLEADGRRRIDSPSFLESSRGGAVSDHGSSVAPAVSNSAPQPHASDIGDPRLLDALHNREAPDIVPNIGDLGCATGAAASTAVREKRGDAEERIVLSPTTDESRAATVPEIAEGLGGLSLEAAACSEVRDDDSALYNQIDELKLATPRGDCISTTDGRDGVDVIYRRIATMILHKMRAMSPQELMAYFMTHPEFKSDMRATMGPAVVGDLGAATPVEEPGRGVRSTASDSATDVHSVYDTRATQRSFFLIWYNYSSWNPRQPTSLHQARPGDRYLTCKLVATILNNDWLMTNCHCSLIFHCCAYL